MLKRMPDGWHSGFGEKQGVRRQHALTTEQRTSQPSRSLFLWTDNGSLLWTPVLPEACTLEILARDAGTHLSSIFQPKTVACFCNMESQCLYNETSREGNSSLEVSIGWGEGEQMEGCCEHALPWARCMWGGWSCGGQ